MFTWHDTATFCEEVYGVALNTKERYFVCPDCFEMICEDDWFDHEDWSECPICGFKFEEG